MNPTQWLLLLTTHLKIEIMCICEQSRGGLYLSKPVPLNGDCKGDRIAFLLQRIDTGLYKRHLKIYRYTHICFLGFLSTRISASPGSCPSSLTSMKTYWDAPDSTNELNSYFYFTGCLKKKINNLKKKLSNGHDMSLIFFLNSVCNELISHGPVTAWMGGCSLHGLTSGLWAPVPQFGHAHTWWVLFPYLPLRKDQDMIWFLDCSKSRTARNRKDQDSFESDLLNIGKYYEISATAQKMNAVHEVPMQIQNLMAFFCCSDHVLFFPLKKQP